MENERVLTVGVGDEIVVGDVEVVVVEVREARVRIGVRAPADVVVMRGEADPGDFSGR